MIFESDILLVLFFKRIEGVGVVILAIGSLSIH